MVFNLGLQDVVGVDCFILHLRVIVSTKNCVENFSQVAVINSN